MHTDLIRVPSNVTIDITNSDDPHDMPLFSGMVVDAGAQLVDGEYYGIVVETDDSIIITVADGKSTAVYDTGR